MCRYLRTGVRLPSPPLVVSVTATIRWLFLHVWICGGRVKRFGSRASGFSDVNYDISLMMYMAVPSVISSFDVTLGCPRNWLLLSSAYYFLLLTSGIEEIAYHLASRKKRFLKFHSILLRIPL